MKKKLTFLLTILVLTLVLCVSAAAEPVSLSGTLGDSDELSWVLEDGTLCVQTTQENATWTGQVMAACYSGGRFSQVRILTPDQPTAQVGSGVNWVKFFWLGETTLAPQCAPAQAAVAPDKVITNGVTRWNDLTNSSSVQYVAPIFTEDCVYFLNGNQVDCNDLFMETAALRGTKVEFYLNASGKIATVKVCYYTVTQITGDAVTKTLSDGTVQVRVPGIIYGWVDADKVTGWEGLKEGDVVLYYTTTLPGGNYDRTYTIEKAQMITGKVSAFNTRGELFINGSAYPASQQDISYVDVPVGEDIFKNWVSYHSYAGEFNFWLDKDGNIVAAHQLNKPTVSERICMVVEAEYTPSTLGSLGHLDAKLLFLDGSTETVAISKVSTAGGELKNVVDKLSGASSAKQILGEEALRALVGDAENSEALTRFFRYNSTDSGYELTELCEALNGGRDWENVVTADGVIPITKTTNFAQGLDIFANSQTVFLVGKYNANNDTVVYQTYKGFQNVPEMDATMVTAIAVNASPVPPGAVNPVVRYVYLETGAFKIAPPDGYVFITDNTWQPDPDLYEDDVYLVNIVDTDGTIYNGMRVSADLKDAISYDSTILNGRADTIFKFWAVSELDENGVVHALGYADGQPAELSNVTAMGDGILTLKNGQAFAYDNDTHFIYVDLGWADGKQDNNTVGVREENLDNWVLSNSGTFDPKHFFNPDEIDANSASGAAYISVEAAVIEWTDDPTLADYVYVLRKLW